MFRRKKPEGDESMTENEPPPESLVAPLAKPVPRPGLAGAPGMAPNRIPTMPPRPTPAELTRPGELNRPTELHRPEPARPAEPMRPSEPVRFGEFGRAGEPARSAEPARAAELPRRPADMPRPSEAARPSEGPRVVVEPEPIANPMPARPEAEVRQLIVGSEISLKGEITHCDRLLIEGSVEANLTDCRDVDIAESGLFKGEAAIESAEIRGRFEGTLTVRKRLFIRATGRVTGTIRYGQIEVERGGRISGDIEATPETAATPETGPSRVA
jgi:cytoskeletal protein CcmA (bactofilin family)